MEFRDQNQVRKSESNRAAVVFLLGITALFLPALCQAQGYLIATYAGTGSPGYSGNGGPAIGAKLNEPYGVALDSNGNLYIADYFNNSVRKVTVGGTITTVAGSDNPGYTGDGGPAINATLNGPEGLAVDKFGNLYITDNGNKVIRMVSAATGNITTVAGGGNGCVQQTDSVGDGCPALNAALNGPTGVAVDAAGNLYIADRLNFRIRKVSGGIITSAAGTGHFGYSGDGGLATNAALSDVEGVAVDSIGQVYIADTANELIRKIDTTGDISTVAGTPNSQGYFGDGSPAVDAKLNGPTAVAVDAAGNFYITDTQNERIREVLAANGNITTIAGSGGCNSTIPAGPALNAPLCNQVLGVAVNVAGVYIADEGLNRVFLLTQAVPPAPVTVFSPLQGATGVSVTPVLTWGQAAGATSYDVYFGTSPAPPFVENTVGTSYTPAPLNPNTVYYWYLISRNVSGATPSALWSFTTGGFNYPPFFTGQVSLGSGVFYLQFPNGNVFGYYNFQYFPVLYHYDLGFDYLIDANDGKGGAFLYDFSSGHWFYTSPSYPFPYLYDFTLHTILYYYPNTASPGHYTTNPRYFYNFSTSKIITM